MQLAKAAIRTGIQVLLEANGCSEEEIKQVIIAGAFGSYIDVTSAVTIGVLRSEEHTSELQSHSFISYAVFCLKKKKKPQ